MYHTKPHLDESAAVRVTGFNPLASPARNENSRRMTNACPSFVLSSTDIVSPPVMVGVSRIRCTPSAVMRNLAASVAVKRTPRLRTPGRLFVVHQKVVRVRDRVRHKQLQQQQQLPSSSSSSSPTFLERIHRCGSFL